MYLVKATKNAIFTLMMLIIFKTVKKTEYLGFLLKLQVDYSPCLFCSRRSIIWLINFMSLILNDVLSNFDILLQNNNDTRRHHRYIQANRKTIWRIILEIFKWRKKKSGNIGFEPKLHISAITLLVHFKESVRKWYCSNFPWRLRKSYLPDLRFLQQILVYIFISTLSLHNKQQVFWYCYYYWHFCFDNVDLTQ